MAQATSSTSPTLSVAIIRDRTEYLTSDESQKIEAAIHKQIMSEACSTKQDEENRKSFRPIFNRLPDFEDCALKMWCENEETLAWLKRAVSTYDQSLVVKSQSEIQKRHTCTSEISDEQQLIDLKNLESVLSYQNSWIDFKRWEVIRAYRNSTLFVLVMSVPEDQVLHLMKAECRLIIGLTECFVRFLYNGKIVAYPYGWDIKTNQFLKVQTNQFLKD